MVTRPNPHDAFFRQAFSSPKHVAGLLKLILPTHLQALLDLDPARAGHRDPRLVRAQRAGLATRLMRQLDELRALLTLFNLRHVRPLSPGSRRPR